MQQPRDFSLYGAVDLGARQAAAQRSQQAAVRSGGQGGSPDGNVTNVIDVTEVDVSMDGIEIQDREFVAAITENREPNASVHQVLQCYEVLDRLDQQIRT